MVFPSLPPSFVYVSSFSSQDSIVSFIDQYLERLSQIIAGCCCGLVLHFFETDNRGNRFINEVRTRHYLINCTLNCLLHFARFFSYILGHLQESDINTPAIGAAFVIKRHNKSDVETEISLEIGELVSVVCLSTQLLFSPFSIIPSLSAHYRLKCHPLMSPSTGKARKALRCVLI